MEHLYKENSTLKGSDFHNEHHNLAKPPESINIVQDTSPPTHFNDEYCFVCKDGGDLYGCDNCHRAYHFDQPFCLPNRSYLQANTDDGLWMCPQCNRKDICPFCETPVFADKQPKQVACALCYRSVHEKCLTLPGELIKTNILVRNDPYLLINCVTCVKSATIKHWLESKSVRGEEYSLVVPLMAANCHQGWLKHKQALEIWSRQKYRPKQIEMKDLRRGCRIAKIIDMKTPLQYKNYEPAFTVDTLSNHTLQRKYGAVNNYRFLVKWFTMPSQEATWEDEVTIIQEKEALKKFINLIKIKIKLAVSAEKGQAPIIYQPDNTLSKSLSGTRNNDNHQLTYVVGDGVRNSLRNIQKKRDILSIVDAQVKNSPNLANPYYHKQVIILTDANNLKECQIQIHSLCQNAIVTILEGDEESAQNIINKQCFIRGTNIPSFNVLLTTVGHFSRYIESIQSLIQLNCLLLVIDCAQKLQNVNLSSLNALRNCEIAFFKYNNQRQSDIQTFLGNRYRRYGDENHFQTNFATKSITDTLNLIENKESTNATHKVIKSWGPMITSSQDAPLADNNKPTIDLPSVTKINPPQFQSSGQSVVPPFTNKDSAQQNMRKSDQTNLSIQPGHTNNYEKTQEDYNVSEDRGQIHAKTTKVKITDKLIEFQPLSKTFALNLKFVYNTFKLNPTNFILNCNVNEAQRACILQYLIAFGLHTPNSFELYENIVKFNRDVFGLGSTDLRSNQHKQQRKKVLKYLQVLLSIVYEDKDTSPKQAILTPLFFGFNHMSLCKHIVELSNLKDMYEEYKHRPSAWPYKKVFYMYRDKSNQPVPAEIWTSQDDIELSRLTLEHGFSNWIIICQSFMSGRLNLRGQQYLIKRLKSNYKAKPSLSELGFCARMLNNRMSAILCELWLFRKINRV